MSLSWLRKRWNEIKNESEKMNCSLTMQFEDWMYAGKENEKNIVIQNEKRYSMKENLVKMKKMELCCAFASEFVQ